MLWIEFAAVASALVGSALCKEQVPNDVLGAELYESGIMMERIMAHKEVSGSTSQDSVRPKLTTSRSSPGNVGQATRRWSIRIRTIPRD
jgi:hypothetical protein